MNTITRIPMILTSAGVDSAAMLTQAVKNSAVDVVYVKVEDDAELARYELDILNITVKELRKTTEHDINVTVLTAAPFMAEHDAELVKATRILMAAVGQVDPNRHSVVRMGGFGEDEIIRSRDKLSKLWFALNATTKWKPVPLEFPLVPYSKLDILGMMSPDILELTWSCELMAAAPCGKCSSCKSIKNAHGEFYRKNGRNF